MRHTSQKKVEKHYRAIFWTHSSSWEPLISVHPESGMWAEIETRQKFYRRYRVDVQL